MFKKILIANRGEIACRVIRTAKRLGIKTVAVYSAADKQAKHVKMADEAYLIGPAPAAESYLKQDIILKAAKDSGAQAIHPGYGFLSENEQFAKACEKANIVFIGPPAKAIKTMGNKSAAKALMVEHNVPVVPGYHGKDQKLKKFQEEADKIGYPVLLKASSGGGGKGMRVVERAEDLEDAFNSAKREAKSSFGNDYLLIEKFIAAPRHIEIQIFSDKHQQTVHLFERDCSIQRRHQKIVEEAPAPGLSDALRERLADAGKACAAAVNYVGAGTIEFLLDTSDEAFYFMEMNTRLQVEHPVTEYITGLDLVEWQLLVASGERLPLKQEEITCHGHAVEVRLYAEDPSHEFLPASGQIHYLHEPEASANVRIDSGILNGDQVGVFYDPMIAKVITWQPTRLAAIQTLRQALAQYQTFGLKTNQAFLDAVLAHQAFQQAKLSTHFIRDHAESLSDVMLPQEVPDHILTLAVLYEILSRQTPVAKHSPWHRHDYWRLNHAPQMPFTYFVGETEYQLTAYFDHENEKQWIIYLGYDDFGIKGALSEHTLLAEIDDKHYEVNVFTHDNTVYIHDGQTWALEKPKPSYLRLAESQNEGSLTAPMPGTITDILVTPGAQVAEGDKLVIMEAMKMEHTIFAPRQGSVTEIFFKQGDLVDEGVELLTLDPIEASS